MIYDSLETIPYKLFIKIIENDNFLLLNTNSKEIESYTDEDVKALKQIWDALNEEHLSKSETSESKKIFKLSKTIDELVATNKVVIMSCASLRFEYNEELVGILKGYGYKLRTDNNEIYHSDLLITEREANAYIIKADYYKSMLPKDKEESSPGEEYTIDDIMASYSAILGINIGDFNTVTYTAFKGYERQVNAKIKSLKESTNGK